MNEIYEWRGENLIWICAWHNPGGRAVLNRCPELSQTVRSKVDITHGVCPACKAAFLNKLADEKRTAI